MALPQACVPRQCFLIPNLPKNLHQWALQGNHTNRQFFGCFATTQIQRRSSNYQPSSWSYDFVKSLKNDPMDETYKKRAKKLEEEVLSMMDDEGASPLAILELIDNIERLGLGYRFEKDITRALDKIVSLERCKMAVEKSFHATALRFRLLRQHGYEVSEEEFRRFKDPRGGPIECLKKDVKGLLSLYEASFLGFERETLLNEVKSFTRIHLIDLEGSINTSLAEEIKHTLELPLHHRMLRQEARWYIGAYSRKEDANPLLLELAALDFNMVQSTFQRDLQEASRWWKSIGLASELSFIRDRLMECFIWTVGVVSEPQYSDCRKGLTEVSALITTIDDVYDVYGSLDELQLFTDAVERWDINAVKHLPDYMKLCFLALYNTVNELAYDTLKEQRENIIPILAKVWADLCQAFMLEAKWNYEKYTPTLEAYLDNAWRSVSGVVILVHAYFLMNQIITEEALESLENHELLKWSSMIFRLCNDLGTSPAELARGETANSILCYMHESGVSEELAREHISKLIDEAWKKLNESRVDDSPFAKPFRETALNLARIAQCTYQYGDGHGAPDDRSKNRVLSLIIKPITLVEKEKQDVQNPLHLLQKLYQLLVTFSHTYDKE